MKIIFGAIIVSIALALGGVVNSTAQVYTWTDENGVKHFGDHPPENAIGVKKAFEEYEYDEEADKQRTQRDAQEIERAVKEIDQQYDAAQQEEKEREEEAEANQPPTMEEKIEDERTRLEQKIAELESLPLEQFGSQQNKIRLIGYYKYRLADLEKDPETYFRQPPPPFQGNVNKPSEDEKEQ